MNGAARLRLEICCARDAGRARFTIDCSSSAPVASEACTSHIRRFMGLVLLSHIICLIQLGARLAISGPMLGNRVAVQHLACEE